MKPFKIGEDSPTISFTVQKSRFSRLFSEKPDRTFLFSQPYLGGLGRIGTIRDFWNIENEDDSLFHRWNRARIVAIAVLQNIFAVRFLTWPFALYLLIKLDAERLRKLVKVVHSISGYADYADSVTLLRIPKQ
ncbi:hypothetical protein [Dyadobacter sp. 676]|uniref:Uncharacterized protein n=1 Tax=Dyadobacter sp. 676 TaxID=3088362 RepID=A0AAU8FPX0_9BACT